MIEMIFIILFLNTRTEKAEKFYAGRMRRDEIDKIECLYLDSGYIAETYVHGHLPDCFAHPHYNLFIAFANFFFML